MGRTSVCQIYIEIVWFPLILCRQVWRVRVLFDLCASTNDTDRLHWTRQMPRGQNLKRSVRSPEEHGCQMMSSIFCTLRAKKANNIHLMQSCKVRTYLSANIVPSLVIFQHCCRDVVGLLGYQRIAQCNFDPPICCVQVQSENIVWYTATRPAKFKLQTQKENQSVQ